MKSTHPRMHTHAHARTHANEMGPCLAQSSMCPVTSQVESKSLDPPHPKREETKKEKSSTHSATVSKLSAASSTTAVDGDAAATSATAVLPAAFDIPVDDYGKYVGFLACSGWDMEQLELEQAGDTRGRSMLSTGVDSEGAPGGAVTDGERRRRSSLNLPGDKAQKKKIRDSMNIGGEASPVKQIEPVKRRDSMR
jgi:hypothetical protein